jgi:hypothetical protein
MPSPPVLAYSCSLCARCFIALNPPEAGDVRCACGAPLSPRSLPLGMYELRWRLPDDGRGEAPEDLTPVRAEHDLGYGRSHGYDATHGGPSGPGDAPAKP